MTTPCRKEMAEKVSERSIIEVRKEQMVGPTSCNATQNPTLRTAYFLKPSLNPNASTPSSPNIQSFRVSAKPDVMYMCRLQPLKGWVTWVHELEETHGPLWRKAGIFDAIKGSNYHIARNTDLLFRLVERWCPETNTFVFPWGEATVTLEDVFVLGGFSPLGESVLSGSSLGDDVKRVENKLIKLYKELRKRQHNVSHLSWQERFMGCGNEIEHAGFLVLWLNRHVFPSKCTWITQAVFSLAARLSCGVKFAFAPAILASIYRDLTLLKTEILGFVSGDSHGVTTLRIRSPLQFVNIWAWERFPSLGPVPRMINLGEVRLARWETQLRHPCSYNGTDIGMSLDSAKDSFIWRPYAMSLENWSIPGFYVDSGMWVVVDSNEERRVFARFLMVCQLVGLDSVEGYNPHRVALQFGFDQDIPEPIDRSESSCKLAWFGYKKKLKGLNLYLPPRLHEGDVTRRYFNWWRAVLNEPEEALVGCKRKKRAKKRGKKMSEVLCTSNENLMEKSPPAEEIMPRNVLREDKHVRKTPVFHMQVGLNSLDSEGTTSQNEPMIREEALIDHDIDTLCSKLAEIDLNRAKDYVADGFIPSEMNSVCSSLPCSDATGCAEKHPSLIYQDKEQTLIEHSVQIEENPENLVDDKSRLSKSNALSPVLEEDEALCQDADMNNPVNISVDGLVDISSDEEGDNSDVHPITALCLEFESRISRLEQEMSVLLTDNVTSTRG